MEHHNNDTLGQFRDILFSYINQYFSNTQEIQELLSLYLEVEYNDPKASLYLAKLHFNQQKYAEVFKILRPIKGHYVEEKLNKKIIQMYSQTVYAYLKTLPSPSKEKLEFLEKLYEEDNNNEFLYLVAKEHLNFANYIKSKELFESMDTSSVYYNESQQFLNHINKKLQLSQKFSHKIKLKKSNNHFLINAQVNGQAITLLIDTGVTYTLVKEEIIQDDLKDKQSIQVNTANGVKQAYLGKVDSFKVQGLELNNMDISSSDLDDEHIDGLLGMSFLKHFDFYIDQEEAVLYLE